MKKFTVQKNLSLRDFTDEVYPQGSFAFLQLLKNKDIKVNGLRVGSNVPLKTGDEVIYYTSPLQESKPSHAVVYEDENIYVCDKPDGVSSEGLASELSEKNYYPVHRLDRNTKGLIVFAKTKDAEAILAAAFKERNVRKIYIALCKNCFAVSAKTLEAYIKKDNLTSSVKISDVHLNGYVKIKTEYKVIESYSDLALVRIVLHTGKTHQIRAHMSHIGCPVLGDEKYGDRNLNKKYCCRRQCLVAKQLKFSLGGNMSYLNGKTFTSSYVLTLPEKE